MKLFSHLAAVALAAIVALGASEISAQEKEPVKFGLCFDLSKSYTFISPQVAQAAQDLAMYTNLNGGIDGHPVEMIVRDHGNEPQRGVECYEQLKREGVFIFYMLSTPVTNAVLPRVMRDENILMQSFSGRADAVDGDVFEWVFPVGPTYWQQAANDIAFIKTQMGDDLNDATIGFIYFDFPFGQEPIEILKTLSEKEGFDLELYPVPLPGSDQSGAWSRIRRDKPDYVISWMLGGGHVVASKEIARNRFPIDRYISVDWINEVDIANIGTETAIGILRGTNVAGGQDIPLVKTMLETLYANGKGSGPEKHVRDVHYNKGLAVYSVAIEAARIAVEQNGWPLTAESMKAGYEAIKNYDAGGIMSPVTVTTKDHGGGGKTRIEQWDGETWVPLTDWNADYLDVVWEVIAESSSKFSLE
ncbi:branched-chain amino acid ABC transporter substrate-binding protein [Salipiger aestuarii]|uniref:Branched-chain amino acid transport system substrate-binding protein n=1 Tax=Salipiger aestuarii TaxID=568098 RepID=A0A327XVN4_9RHOB|nr:ABC transporter substrate-binding protein [Salipiger aestuarii]EIE50641.1 putative branched-chain amino acid transport system substrate-binding protein [Citreicella sp. 357]KAA8603676.1 branched-chain amino acid ABC transporter substrate-binding protein [Salipiger aestuarii]KAA8605689.1 branched-chain amino acid ABC transporter substrate-binding protein [Salipiger aestuarii]KAB2530872.1 branched-chain amino acid ABC transporter substrate-binding protein [Salipiger aestuarii]RAK11325.1 branc